MTQQTINLLTEAALMGLATAGICLVLAIIGLCIWQVYQAVYSPIAKRNRAFQKRLAKNSAHNRKMLNLSR